MEYLRLPVTYVRLLLPDHYGSFQVDVDDDEEFVVTGLEEKVLDVRKQDIFGRASGRLDSA